MKILKTDLPGVLQVNPKVFKDERGFFLESYSHKKYKKNGIEDIFIQDNHSRSCKSVLRGLHYQLKHPQGKLVKVVSGSVFDVAVDIRFGSPTFGKSAWTILSDQNHYQFYIPPGFAHGFCVLSDVADFEYKCSDYYYPEDEFSLAWNDSSLNIPWPSSDPIVSEKDKISPNLSDIPNSNLPQFTE
jgi:dTDP-4-dehydrorhamnose 3,5-epimerase